MRICREEDFEKVGATGISEKINGYLFCPQLENFEMFGNSFHGNHTSAYIEILPCDGDDCATESIDEFRKALKATLWMVDKRVDFQNEKLIKNSLR